MDAFVPYIEAAISRGSAVSVKGMNKSFMSIKRYLSNGHIWRKTADTELLPCRCKKMSRLLGVELSGSARCCVRLKDRLFGQKNQENCSADPIILPSTKTFVNSFVEAVNHILEAPPGIDNEKLY